MSKARKTAIARKPDELFERVVRILEQARGNVVRSVNSNMVLAYWLIGREIVEEAQGGQGRAGYGEKVIEYLSARLTERYGRGFAEQSLQNFRRFYLAYSARVGISSPTGRKSTANLLGLAIPRPTGVKSEKGSISFPASTKCATAPIPSPTGRELARAAKSYPSGSESAMAFSPLLSWSHYRALMRVEDPEARLFYEHEAAECAWSKSQLERQIHSLYYQRIIANRGKAGLATAGRKRLAGEPMPAEGFLKSPYVLEFLGLPDTPELHEDKLEQAIIDNLQRFLLELGKGFSFVARQKHIRFDDEDFYIDLVFYNYLMKCFLLIELKIGRLTHRDVGQMDGYVRLYDEQFRVPGDNPTVGLILCSDKGEAVARYSVLRENRQVFASRYMQFLPTEDQLRREIEKERKLIEAAWKEEREGNQP